jgi:peptidoglycan/LPS O-acetylase OafA/YrhL
MQKIEQLTFTRFVAAIAIVIFHFGLQLPMFQNSLGALLHRADTGVSYFYVLSGFIMVVAYGNQPTVEFGTYLQNRIARIYPTYLVALLAHMLVAKLFLAKTFALNLLALQAWSPGKVLSLNYPGWSISVEFFFYALFPLLYNRWYTKQTSIRRVAAPIFLIWLLSQVFLHWFTQSAYYSGKPSASHDFAYYFPLWHLNQFLVGNLFGLMYLRGNLAPKSYDKQLLLLVAALVTCIYVLPLNYHNGLLAGLFGSFMLYLSRNTGWFTKLFNLKFLVFLGEISFAVYLFQLPVYLLCLKCAGTWAGAQPTTFFLVYVMVLLMVSAASYQFLERRAQVWLRSMRFPLFK